jgi:hypothetical protein
MDMFTKETVVQDFTCPQCSVSLLPQWQESAPDDMALKCKNGHESGKTAGQLRQELLRIGIQRVASILSGKADTLPRDE